MKKVLKLVLWLFTILGILFGGLIAFGLSVTSDPSEYAKMLAEEVNKLTPVSVGSSTTMVSAQSVGASVIYNYVISNASVEELDRDKFISIVGDGIFKNEKGMCFVGKTKRAIKTAGVTFELKYVDKNKKSIGTIIVNKENCGL